VRSLIFSERWPTVDLACSDVSPEVSVTFTDPQAPRVEWLEVNYKPPGGAWSSVSDFTTDFAPGTLFTAKFKLEDLNADLSSCVLKAIGPDETETALFVGGASGEIELISAEFRLDEGDWTIVARVADRTHRVTEAVLTEIGGSTPVALRIRDGTSSLVANPVAVPRGHPINQPILVTLACSTLGATIEFQRVPVGGAAGEAWSPYMEPVTVFPNSSLYARARAPGMTTSPMVKHEYRLLDLERGGRISD